jgi:pyruvate/2-oxoglutarate dehydrogenase complex dihydrolipoamide acyltransferase (E2) component
MRILRPVVAVCMLLPPLTLAAPVTGQDVQYETVTRVDLPGVAGTVIRVAARLSGGSMETVEMTYIKGNRMRSDVDRQSTITDLENRRMIHIDHAARTYTVFSFDEMMARLRDAGEAVTADQRQVAGRDEADTQLRFRFAVDDARQRERIAGYNADRFFLTMEMEGEFTPEGETRREKGGTLVVLTEMWSSRDVPVMSARQTFDQTTAREYAAASGKFMEGIAAAFADEPDLKVAFEASARELAKMEGIPVRTITRFVTVAPDHRFDRQLAVEPQQRENPAAQAARAGLGRLAARAQAAAGGQQQQQQREEAEPTQLTFMTVTSEIRNVITRTLDAKLFEIPADYREIKPD